jgi:hypothetical protein
VASDPGRVDRAESRETQHSPSADLAVCPTAFMHQEPTPVQCRTSHGVQRGIGANTGSLAPGPAITLPNGQRGYRWRDGTLRVIPEEN